jgi:hypothetical protein
VSVTNLVLDAEKVIVAEDMTDDYRMIVLPDGTTKFVNVKEEYKQEMVV